MLRRSKMPKNTPDDAPARRLVLRRLGRRDRRYLRDHLIGLGPNGRRMRFCGQPSNEVISDYVDAIDWRHAVLIGQFDGAQLVGVAELFPTLPRWARCAELAVSVSRDWRGKGLGAALTEAALTHAQDHRIRRVTLLISPENQAMLAVAEHQGARLLPLADMVVARLRLRAVPHPALQGIKAIVAMVLPPWGRAARAA